MIDPIEQAIDMVLAEEEASDLETRIMRHIDAEYEALEGYSKEDFYSYLKDVFPEVDRIMSDEIYDQVGLTPRRKKQKAKSDKFWIAASFTIDGLDDEWVVRQYDNGEFKVIDQERQIVADAGKSSASDAITKFFNELVKRGEVDPDADVHMKPWG